MVKVNWREVTPTIAHDAGIDWQLLTAKRPGDSRAKACMESMMYIARASLQPTLQYHDHKHDDHEEIYYIISGSGEIKIDDEVQPIREGDIVFIGVGQYHQIRNTGDVMLDFLAVGAAPHKEGQP